jgi:rhodanese-related sulfurtransferase
VGGVPVARVSGAADDRPVARRTVGELLGEAWARIERLTPAEALAAAGAGALIVDIRSDADRERTGVVPGSLHVPRTVLEWRLDPAGEWHSPYAPPLDRQVLVLCDHGYSSSLAAAVLVELGFERAGDVIGGVAAWRDAGLPVVPAPPEREPGVLPGMAPPEPA